MPILKEMSKDPEIRTKFNFVAIPQAKGGKGWSEEEAITLFGVDTYYMDWDGGMRCSAHWQEVRAAMEDGIRATFPDADNSQVEDEPVAVYVPAKETVHAVSMNANAVKASAFNNTHASKFQYKPEDRYGFFRFDTKKHAAQPLTIENVKAFLQALDNRANNNDLGTDKPGGQLFIKKYAKNQAKFVEMVGRPVKWELRLAEPA